MGLSNRTLGPLLGPTLRSALNPTLGAGGGGGMGAAEPTLPDAPTIGVAVAGVESADVAFTANGDGGSAITSFTATPTYPQASTFDPSYAGNGDLVFSVGNTVVTKGNGTSGGSARALLPMAASGKGALDIIFTFSGDVEPTLELYFGDDPDAYDLLCQIDKNGDGASTDEQVASGLGAVATGGHRRVLIDRAAGKVFVGNGSAIAGDPEAGTGEAFVVAPGAQVWFGVSLTGTNAGSATVSGSYSSGSYPTWLMRKPNAGLAATGPSSPINVPGLNSSLSYTFTVHATNAVGDSAESAASNAVTPDPVP